MTQKEQQTLLKISSLLNCIRYFIKDRDLKVVDEYYKLCRKYCSWGVYKKRK